MSAVGIASESLDESSLRAMVIRWKLAQLYLDNHPEAAERGRMALKMLLDRDFPVLLRKIMQREATAL